MSYVKAKKSLGQHFLKDQNIARKIVASLQANGIEHVLEIGPGMGVLTKILTEQTHFITYAIDIDQESITYLEKNFPAMTGRIIHGDFLKMTFHDIFPGKFAVIGNFPYNISTQIFFKILENRNLVPELVGMVQKEVAERIAAPPGSKTYGILSVLLQAFYKIDYLFTVHEHVFAPPPKVKSAVIRFTRNQTLVLDCDEKLFFVVVKTGFNQRRKTLHNSLKGISNGTISDPIFQKRPEQLSVAEFVRLTQLISGNRGQGADSPSDSLE